MLRMWKGKTAMKPILLLIALCFSGCDLLFNSIEEDYDLVPIDQYYSDTLTSKYFAFSETKLKVGFIKDSVLKIIILKRENCVFSIDTIATPHIYLKLSNKIVHGSMVNVTIVLNQEEYNNAYRNRSTDL
jgi:hypothetical protein